MLHDQWLQYGATKLTRGPREPRSPLHYKIHSLAFLFKKLCILWHDVAWCGMILLDVLCSWLSSVLHDVSWCHGVQWCYVILWWFTIVLRDVPWCSLGYYDASWCFMMFDNVMWFVMKFFDAFWYYMIPHTSWYPWWVIMLHDAPWILMRYTMPLCD